MRCRRREPIPEEARRGAALLERRWTLSILYASVEGAARFNEFVAVLGRVPPATLTARLTELAEAGLLQPRGALVPPPGSRGWWRPASWSGGCPPRGPRRSSPGSPCGESGSSRCSASSSAAHVP